MVKIIWTQRSLTDLKSIADYISQDSIKYASLTIERIINIALYLETNPGIGRMVPEMGNRINLGRLFMAITGSYTTSPAPRLFIY